MSYRFIFGLSLEFKRKAGYSELTTFPPWAHKFGTPSFPTK